jgi:hypothetical protein
MPLSHQHLIRIFDHALRGVITAKSRKTPAVEDSKLPPVEKNQLEKYIYFIH